MPIKIKNRIYIGIELKKKGKGLDVDCALISHAASRKQALEILKEHANMDAEIILTEKEALKLHGILTNILRRGEYLK